MDELLRELVAVCERSSREIRIMEVCGTHTVSIFRSGLKALLPDNLRLISGPGCPVCVTPQRYIDAAVELTSRPGMVLATYGDMVRVPGAEGSLEQARARGGVVLVVYSIEDAVAFAAAHPDRTVVFLGVGFETTSPTTAAGILMARRLRLGNFCVLPAHKSVLPAMMALLAGGDVPLDGFLCPGHVSVIIGSEAYRPIVAQHRRPCVVAGFEAGLIMEGLLRLARMVLRGEPALDNVYPVAVAPHGNPHALRLADQVFEPADAVWRGIGAIPDSGLRIRSRYAEHDAVRRFDISFGPDRVPPGCRCGEVLQGKVSPSECALFGGGCTPNTPVGPCMVSSEGTCAAWFRYGCLAPANGSAAQQATAAPRL
jgi:hydrogenase expression/formation protein HypD